MVSTPCSANTSIIICAPVSLMGFLLTHVVLSVRCMQLGSCKHDLPAFTVRHLYNKTALVSLFKRRRLNLRGTTLVAVIRPLNHPCRPGTLFSSHSYPRWHETIWITVINRPDLHRPFALDPAAPGEPSVSVCTASHHPAALCASPGTYSFPSLHCHYVFLSIGNPHRKSYISYEEKRFLTE